MPSNKPVIAPITRADTAMIQRQLDQNRRQQNVSNWSLSGNTENSNIMISLSENAIRTLPAPVRNSFRGPISFSTSSLITYDSTTRNYRPGASYISPRR